MLCIFVLFGLGVYLFVIKLHGKKNLELTLKKIECPPNPQKILEIFNYGIFYNAPRNNVWG